MKCSCENCIFGCEKCTNRCAYCNVYIKRGYKYGILFLYEIIIFFVCQFVFFFFLRGMLQKFYPSAIVGVYLLFTFLLCRIHQKHHERSNCPHEKKYVMTYFCIMHLKSSNNSIYHQISSKIVWQQLLGLICISMMRLVLLEGTMKQGCETSSKTLHRLMHRSGLSRNK